MSDIIIYLCIDSASKFFVKPINILSIRIIWSV